MIESWEAEIRCEWVSANGRMEGNEVCRRIERLTKTHLVELSHDCSGWDTLFVDPADGRFWERIYPLSHMQGGGPALLRVLSEGEARDKYGEPVRISANRRS